MTEERNKGMDIDGLLRKALADDLPDEVAAGMRTRIGRFRAEMTMDRVEAAATAPATAWAWLIRRGVWAALSILMLVAGILLQGRESSSPLVVRISAVKTEFASLETTRR
jgi:hypothetical protein